MGKPPESSATATSSPRLSQVIDLLQEEVRELIERHPWGHLLDGETRQVEISFEVPLRQGPGGRSALAEELPRAVEEAIHSLLARRLTFRPGRVFCLRCRSGDCSHAAPASSRQVFASYASTGIPRFADLSQLLLELQDERVSRLYGARPRLVALVVPEERLMADLLPAFDGLDLGYRLHGQVVVGWYRGPGGGGREGGDPVALSLQVISTRQPRRRWHFALNVVGVAPDGSPLETLHDLWDELPWLDTVRWGSRALADIERGAAGRRVSRKRIEGRVAGLLEGLARRLLKSERSGLRRTRHAEVRRRQIERPTDKAMSDLLSAGRGQVLVDTRRQTLIVLGERGRAHVFSPEGKHVTSIRYSPSSIERRLARETWRPAGEQEAEELRLRVEEVARSGEG